MGTPRGCIVSPLLRLKLPKRIVTCPNCLNRFDADSDVLWFFALGLLLGALLGFIAH